MKVDNQSIPKKVWAKPQLKSLSINKTREGDPGDVYDDINYARLS